MLHTPLSVCIKFNGHVCTDFLIVNKQFISEETHREIIPLLSFETKTDYELATTITPKIHLFFSCVSNNKILYDKINSNGFAVHLMTYMYIMCLQ